MGIVPAVIVCCVVRSFALNNPMSDLDLLGTIGLLGSALKSLDYRLRRWCWALSWARSPRPTCAAH